MNFDLHTDNPIPTDNNPLMSSQFGSSIGGATQDGEQTARPRRPNPLSMNLMNDDITKIVDLMANEVRSSFEEFLTTFTEVNEEDGILRFPYLDHIRSLRAHDKTTIYVDLHHVFDTDETLYTVINTQYYRVESYLKQAVQNIIAREDPEYLRMRTGKYAGDGGAREFWIGFYNLQERKRLREIKTQCIGNLISITGTVTRTSEVRPELLYGTFQCPECLTIIKDVEQQFKYTEPKACPNISCNNTQQFSLQIEKSKFCDWQKIRIQENADEIPSGAMPRSMDVILRNELAERAKAGDRCLIVGCPIVVPDVSQLFNDPSLQKDSSSRISEGYGNGITGLKTLGVRELSYKLVMMASFIRHEQDKTALNALHDMFTDGDIDQIAGQFSQDELEELEKMRSDRHLYHKLISSISPHIFGHEDIKKGILLHLLGGVHKVTPEGIKLRGDINVCIVGDPSTAKSQFLKYVSGLMPRAIYTSGKASSAAGLTASVVKDEETGNFTIEAGALMLADNGVCCIDEFDKMDLTDQVAIHEAMEQQTISITKAGIRATLNARTAILAAANPVHGRYDKKLSLRQNINMSPPIVSRFDLFFVILDEGSEATDYNIAKHIVNFHRFLEDGVQPEYTRIQLLRYLQYAKGLKPYLVPAAREYLAEKYVRMRQEDTTVRNAYRLTVRQLESMLRLAEALAKLHFSDTIEVSHVMEAHNLMKTSIVTIDREREEIEESENVAAMYGHESMNIDGVEESMEIKSKGGNESHKLYLSANAYQAMTEQIIYRICQYESRRQESGMRRSAIFDWFIESHEDEISSEEDLAHHGKLIRSVVNRMMIKDKSLLQLDSFEETDEDNEDPLLTVSPHHKTY